MLLQGNQGMTGKQVGQNLTVGFGETSDLLVSELMPPLYEATYRGQVFFLDSDAVTLAAANTTKGALGTVKLINGLYNPVGSGRNAAITHVNVSVVSGTPAGPFFWNYLSGVVLSNAATGAIHSAFIGGAAPSFMIPEVGVVLASNTPGATAPLIQLATIGGPAAIAAGAGMNSIFEDTRGRIIVPPGVVFGITTVGAGTTCVVQSTISWAEVAI
jgi:hypothetical protein